jgi:predicted SAM-dependent methyltransferase/glycosyltransferase involved in cell wall biosynthesis
MKTATLHVLGVAHTIPTDDYAVCAFTSKIQRFPDLVRPYGWRVVEYTNEGSASSADEHVVILDRERFKQLSLRKSREEPMDPDVNNAPMRSEFEQKLLLKLREKAQPSDIICHTWGPNMAVYEALPKCHHVEINVGYTAWPGLPFRVYETSAWMHWHHGRASREDGSNYQWVIPTGFKLEEWPFCAEPEDYAVFLGRVSHRKGMNVLVDIAKRMPGLPIHVYGPGDPSPWAKDAPPNLIFKGTVLGAARAEVVRKARCMLMPTIYIEPFGNSGVEAQLCGVPLIGSSYGAFQEILIEGVTGYRCHTLADWVEAIRRSASLDRKQISEIARKKYNYQEIGRQYDWAFQQLADLSGPGWYGQQSRKFEAPDPSVIPVAAPRIWLLMPHFGKVPEYFQLYLDSLGRNDKFLSVIFVTDVDLSAYRLPSNLHVVTSSLEAQRPRAAAVMRQFLGVNADPADLVPDAYKLCDFRVMYLEMYADLLKTHGVSENDFVGWGDCDLVYGRFADFIDNLGQFDMVGGYHGHFTAMRNTPEFRQLFLTIENLTTLLQDPATKVVDEIAFRKPMQKFLEQSGKKMFYMNRYFCDIVPPVFFGMFRVDHAQREKNFFDVYNSGKDIDFVESDAAGRLTVYYDDGSSRPAIYCHLQKRKMDCRLATAAEGYQITENAFEMPGTRQVPASSTSALGNLVAANRGVGTSEIDRYLATPGPHKLEIGAGPNGKAGWLATDLQACRSNSGGAVIALDATKRFPLPDNSFDRVYTEHMIEHIPFDDGLNMLGECHRVLKPGGVLRVVTPSILFLQRIISDQRSVLEQQYRNWAVKHCIIDPPAVTNAMFLNNFVRAWGHQFIYDHETLQLALRLAGFTVVKEFELNESDHEDLKNLECESRLPEGFLRLESMVFEAVKSAVPGSMHTQEKILSRGKSATQSSISQWSKGKTREEDAARVVSGQFTNDFNNHTSLDDLPWWQVDLLQVSKISRVHIHNRRSNLAIMARLLSFDIMISVDGVQWETVFRKRDSEPVHGHRLMPYAWVPSAPVDARFVRIQIPGKSYLHLEQVEVLGE